MFAFQPRHAGFCLALAASAGLLACSNLNSATARMAGVVTPYKIDIVQGNFVSKEQAAAIKPGMSRAQVRDILGTPLLTSIFHADRWDYVFTFKRQGLEPQARKVTVFFKADVLERIEADALPTEAEFVASLDSGRKTGKVPVLEMSAESLKQLPPPAKADLPVAPPPMPANPPAKADLPVAPPPMPANYPPLEPLSR